MNSTSKKQKSLYRKLTLAMVVLVSLVSIAANLLNYIYSSRQAEALYQSKSSEYAGYLHDALEWPLWNIDDELVGKIGSAFSANAEIASLTIRDDRKRVIYHQRKSDGHELKSEITIEHNGENIGNVEIGLSLSAYEQRNQHLLWASLATMILLIVVLFGATRWILSRLLKKPVDAFVAATADMVKGKYRQIELPETYVEFTSILSGFKTMSEAVASRESSLRESEERLHLATTAGNIGVWDWDVVNNALYWDESMYALYGIIKEDFGGAYDAWMRTLHPDDRQFTDGEIQAALRGEREYAPEFRIVRPDGTVRIIKAASKTYYDPQGNPIRMVGTNIDITERKKAEEELRNMAAKFRTVFESSFDAIMLLDEKGFFECNEATLRVFGCASRDDFINKHPSQFSPPTQPGGEDSMSLANERMAMAFKTGSNQFEWMHCRLDGTEFFADVLLTAMELDGKPVLQAVVRDITARKRTEEQLRKYKDHLEEEVQLRTADLVLARNAAEAANKAKSVFLSSMSHELRTPLNAILGFSNMMRKDPLLQHEQRENLDIINRSGEHLLSLINDVLEMAKIEAGRVQLESVPFDLGGVVRDVTDMMHVRAQEKGLQLLIEQSSEFPRYIKGDEARLRQVLINLVGNAVKFTQQGGVTLRFGIKPHATPQRLLIEIEDSGIGIKPEDQQKIFEPFVQLGKTAMQKGTGLGLTITRQFVQLMGGAISVESTPGKGSTFRVELPVDKVDAADVLKPESVEKGEILGLAPDQPEYRILIVEDQLENQLLLAKLMKSIGFPFKVAENGEQAVELFQSWQPHLIWMDRRMPVMDGVEATQRIRELPGGKGVKIVAVTASAFTEQRDEMLKAGMDDFVRKPYRFNEIYECLSKQLGVQYTYADTPAADEVSDGVLTAQMLATMQPDLRRELHDALESLEGGRISAVIQQVASHDSKLHKTLSHLAENFDYPAILKALEKN